MRKYKVVVECFCISNKWIVVDKHNSCVIVEAENEDEAKTKAHDEFKKKEEKRQTDNTEAIAAGRCHMLCIMGKIRNIESFNEVSWRKKFEQEMVTYGKITINGTECEPLIQHFNRDAVINWLNELPQSILDYIEKYYKMKV